ncbi:MAG: Rrf2 family transcriptional regulator [Nitrospirae bacterium]|nr:Rrf2 family transcriptional regulator [Nitrospirota bacterium]
MRLTQYTDYSLRVLIYLGLRGDHPSTIREIARSYGISRNHLMKVVHRLGQFGYVDTLRGRGGGIRLSRAAADIRLGEVVRKTEENWTLVECFDLASNTCRIDPVCSLKQAIGKALSSFYAVLDGYTLEDVLRRRKALSAMLRVDRSPTHPRSADPLQKEVS